MQVTGALFFAAYALAAPSSSSLSTKCPKPSDINKNTDYLDVWAYFPALDVTKAVTVNASLNHLVDNAAATISDPKAGTAAGFR